MVNSANIVVHNTENTNKVRTFRINPKKQSKGLKPEEFLKVYQELQREYTLNANPVGIELHVYVNNGSYEKESKMIEEMLSHSVAAIPTYKTAPRMLQIMEHLSKGSKLKRIGVELGLKKETVRTYCKLHYRKTGKSGVHHLIIEAVEKGLV